MGELSKPRVLFLHGFMGSALNWGSIRNLLEAKIPVQTLAVDLLGHALRHSKNSPSNAHEALVNDLESQILDFKPTHVVAHSFAFRPALLLGNRKPQLIPQIFVEDSTPDLSPQAHAYIMGILNTPMPFPSRDLARDFFDNKFGKQSAISRFLMSNIRSNSNGEADWRFDREFLKRLLNESLNNALWKEWTAYPGKTCLIYGSKSDGINSTLIEKMKASRPDLDVYCVDDAGHWIHADKPKEFVDLLAKLITKNL